MSRILDDSLIEKVDITTARNDKVFHIGMITKVGRHGLVEAETKNTGYSFTVDNFVGYCGQNEKKAGIKAGTIIGFETRPDGTVFRAYTQQQLIKANYF